MAGGTASTLAVSLGVLYAVTSLAGQPFTVAMLGVVISMISSMALDDPDVRERALTAVLMLAAAAAAVTAGAFLAPEKVLGDVVFVAIMMAATYTRRFGMRGTMLGMVAFMTYFFSLFLGATPSMLGWLILALAIGMLVSFAMRTFVLRDRPDRRLRRTLNALRARIAGVLDAVDEALVVDEPDDRATRRLGRRVRGVRETTLMIEGQLDDAELRGRWPQAASEQLSLALFDIELATEQLVGAGRRAAVSTDVAADVRQRLVGALGALRAQVRAGGPAEGLGEAGRLAEAVRSDATVSPAARGLAVAVGDLVRALAAGSAAERAPTQTQTQLAGAGPETAAAPAGEASAPPADDSWIARIPPSARQAIQVGVASSLAIVAGELLSPARWYWAVIAAFVVFSGTSSRGETLTKGWQRVLGTILGVGFGVLVASLVAGGTATSIVLIFVCMFAGFYLIQIAYGLMVFWVSTMLALLYGLLGEFSIGLLVTRIEETAIGAAIGIIVAALVLPTSTGSQVTADLESFLTGLAGLVGRGADSLGGESVTGLGGEARALDQSLAALRTSARPLTTGIAGVNHRSGVRRAVNAMSACDHYARGLARVSGPAPSAELRDRLARSARCVAGDIDSLARSLDGAGGNDVPGDTPPRTAGALLDDAREALDRDGASPSERRRLTAAVGYLRQLDLAIDTLRDDLAPAAATRGSELGVSD